MGCSARVRILWGAVMLAAVMAGTSGPARFTLAQPQTKKNPAPPEPQEAVLILTDGRRVTGILIEDGPQAIVLEIGKVRSTFPRNQVQRMFVLAPPAERYKQMRAIIADDDVPRLLMLAKWLLGRQMLDEALLEVDQALKTAPTHSEAKKLRTLVLQHQKLRESAADRNKQDPATQATPKPRQTQTTPVLTAEQINLIKVLEVDLGDPPRIKIQHDTIAKLMERYSDSPLIPATREGREAMYRKRPVQILAIMFQLQARDLYPEVRIIDHPGSMAMFRNAVHKTWLINSCATSRCHGGEESGRLRLVNRLTSSDATVYTNFLILERFRTAQGLPLINYEDPARSGILQLGLPRKDSVLPHPVVATEHVSDAWRPAFRTSRDRRFRQATDWIRSMYQPRPEYPIDYPANPVLTEESQDAPSDPPVKDDSP